MKVLFPCDLPLDLFCFRWIHFFLILPAPCISESWIKRKINLNFYFHTSFVVPQKGRGGGGPVQFVTAIISERFLDFSNSLFLLLILGYCLISSCYYVENSISMFIWVGLQTPLDILQQVFGINGIGQLDIEMVSFILFACVFVFLLFLLLTLFSLSSR